jgi:tRNA(Arg) A34 adenosine deaminase TadA
MSKHDFSNSCLAWVTHKETTYFVQKPKEQTWPTSSAQKLIQEVFEKFYDHSFFILRNPLFTTEAQDPATQSMVKVVAKRARYSQSLEVFFSLATQKVELGCKEVFFSESPDQQSAELDLSQFAFADLNLNSLNDHQIVALLKKVIESLPRGKVLHDYHRPIAALLLNEKNQIVSLFKNTNARSKTLHAEVNLIQNWYNKIAAPIPEHYKIFVTLKPCRMCADLIAKCSHPKVPIYFLENDPGPLAQGSQIEERLIQFIPTAF